MPQSRLQRPSGPASTAMIGENLKHFQQNVKFLQRLVDSIGKQPVADQQLRAQIAVVDDLAVRIGQQLSEQVRDLERRPKHEAAALRVQHAKLSKDYNRVLNQCKLVKQKAIEKQNQLRAAPSDFKVLRDPETIEGDLKLQVQLQDEAVNEAILLEREKEMVEIHQKVSKVNEIFRDLANIVADQQEEIDSVEQMVDRSHQHARQGLTEVEKANEHNAGCVVS